VDRKRALSDDPFIDIEELWRDDDVVSYHVSWTESAYKTCGQLIAYATTLHRSQFRVFSFSIALYGDTGRLLRWDPDVDIFEFLWRFNHLLPVDRVPDATVTSAEDDEIMMALPKLRTYPKFQHVQKDHLHRNGLG
jgi:hypothetical protein